MKYCLAALKPPHKNVDLPISLTLSGKPMNKKFTVLCVYDGGIH